MSKHAQSILEKLDSHPLAKRASELTQFQQVTLFNFIVGYGLVTGATVEEAVTAAFKYYDSIGGVK